MSKYCTYLLLLAIGLGIVSGCRNEAGRDSKPPNNGKFVGEVEAKWIIDGRSMQLLSDFGYLDPRGKLWVAPAESIIDGASIPQVFWSIIGGPFEGKYRDASVVHDTACDKKREPWQAVHKMFYEACLCGGTEPWRAKVMYLAVYKFGPKWELRSVAELVTTEDGKIRTVERKVVETLPAPAPPSEDELRTLTEYVKRNDPSIEEIERLDISKIIGKQGN